MRAFANDPAQRIRLGEPLTAVVDTSTSTIHPRTFDVDSKATATQPRP